MGKKNQPEILSLEPQAGFVYDAVRKVIRFAASPLKNHIAQSPKKQCLQPHYVLEATEFASSCTFRPTEKSL